MLEHDNVTDIKQYTIRCNGKSNKDVFNQSAYLAL